MLKFFAALLRLFSRLEHCEKAKRWLETALKFVPQDKCPEGVPGCPANECVGCWGCRQT